MHGLKRLIVGGAMAVCAAALPAAAQADVVTYEYDDVLTGATPGGTPPWLSATFTDVSGGVTLDLAAIGLVNSEFVSNFWFAFTDDSLIDVGDLSWSFDSGVEGTITFDIDGFSSGGGGSQNFDINVSFPTSNAQGGALRFGVGDTASFTILGLSTADILGFGESNNSTAPQVNTVAHVQGLANGASSKVFDDEPGGGGGIGQIPEPGTLSLLGLGLIGLVGAGRARRRRTA